MSDDEYGPPLPPGLQNPEVKNKDEPSVGPQLPSTDSIGPSLPPGFSKSKDSIGPSLPQGFSGSQDSVGPSLPPESTNKGSIGPSLPPGFLVSQDSIGPSLPPGSTNKGSIGPSLPPRFSESNDSIGPSKTNANVIGPCLPPGFQTTTGHDSDDSDSDYGGYIGPMPSEMSSMEDNKNYTSSQFEQRARLMKDKLEGKEAKEEKIQRESWMMELPSAGLAKTIGLTARTFRTKAAPDMEDRSMWTDTPADKERKQKEDPEERSDKQKKHDGQVTSVRDKQMAKEVDKYNKSKRPLSLLEMHEKERKKLKKEKGDEPKVRRPFDREIDLQSNKFDDAQRQSIIKKSRDLNTKFSKGKFSSQFL